MLKKEGPVHAPSKPPNLIGFGPTPKRILFVVVIVAIVAGFGYLPLYEKEYKAKSYAKMACNEMVIYREYEGGDQYGETTKWEPNFQRRLIGLKLPLDQDQYSFSVTKVGNDKVCRIQLAFEQVGEWALISDFIDDLPELKTVHRLDFTHTVRKDY